MERGLSTLRWRATRSVAALPPAFPGAPLVCVLRLDQAPGAALQAETLRTIRAESLWWPTPARDAERVETLLALSGSDAMARLLRGGAPAARSQAVLLTGRVPRWLSRVLERRWGLRCFTDPRRISPENLRRVDAAARSAVGIWAALGGVASASPPGALVFVDPWSGRRCGEAEALSALQFLRRAADRFEKPVVTVGLSPWKRRTAEPFLTGRSGRPRHRARLSSGIALARRIGGDVALWGPSREAAAQVRAEGLTPILLEDGFIRSVGLGVQHERACSLVAARQGLHFESDRTTDLRMLLAAGAPSSVALAEAARLRALLVRESVTKYNLEEGAAALPETDKLRVLVPGQVEGDASLRYGGGLEGGNLELLRRVRRRRPDAFVLYKPHPDVVAGYRDDRAYLGEVDGLADAVVADVSAQAAIAWADVVETMTSQLGFEALLRGKSVVCHGNPFYGELGLTEDLAPRRAPLQIELDHLVSACLATYPLYADHDSGLPAPLEVVLARLLRIKRSGRPPFVAFTKRLVSRALNYLP